ncbi:MAG: hypothetical protein LBQ20_10675 [Rhodanobacter sp.]|nr:hypothetical protein [Rhodanobacter sp.]
MKHAAHAYAWWGLFVLACAAGIWLRVDQLAAQMLIDDEWHAVRKLLDADYASIATHFGASDYCIPLTLYYRWLFEHGVLNEWRMHLPLLVAGVATLFVLPWLLRHELSLPVRALWIGLLAISPSLIHFSRMARPYALVVLLGPLAILAFRAWQREPSTWRRWLPLYIVATCAAGWLHLLSLVFTLWPFAFYGLAALYGLVDPATRVRSARNLVLLCAVGVCVALVLTALLVPPILHDWASMRVKAGMDSVTLESLYRTLLMQLGTGHAWLGALLAVALLAGSARLWRRDREFAALVLSGTLVGSVVICLARPVWIQHAPVLLRYTVALLPFLLLLVAEGIAAAIQHVAAPWNTALTAAIIAALAAFGPLPSWYYRPNQFMEHALFQFDYDPEFNPYVQLLELGPVPAFYRTLAQRAPGSVTLIEAPRLAISNYMPEAWYQPIHRQNVKYALVGTVCGVGEWDVLPSTQGMPFKRLVELGDVLAGARRGDYLVLNLTSWTLPPGETFPAWPDMAACTDKVAARLGVPLFRDDTIVVWRLR